MASRSAFSGFWRMKSVAVYTGMLRASATQILTLREHRRVHRHQRHTNVLSLELRLRRAATICSLRNAGVYVEPMGCRPIRHGRKHDCYQNPQTGMAQPVPERGEVWQVDFWARRRCGQRW